MAGTQKSSAEQTLEIQKLIEDAQEKLAQAEWALKTLVVRLEGSGEEHESET
jgi:hypothetical protein